jgi:hypothetical protein
MLEVVIYLDYKHNDQTLAAIQVANWLLSLGYRVLLVSDGKVARNVDTYWDSKVVNAADNTLDRLIGADYVCWFYPNVNSLKLIRYVSGTQEKKPPLHIYFPGFGRAESLKPEFFSQVDKTICLNRDLALWLSSNVHAATSNQSRADLTSCDRTLNVKCGKLDQEFTRLAVYLGADFVANIGSKLLTVLSDLLKSCPTAKLTFATEKTLPRQYRSHMSRLISAYEGRVSNFGVIPYSRYPTWAYLSDWVYIASASFKYGAIIPHLEVSGTPLICHDIPPARSYISGSLSGLIVPTAISTTSYPIGKVSFSDIFDTLKTAVNYPELGLRGLQKNLNDNRKKRAIAFGCFLQKELA